MSFRLLVEVKVVLQLKFSDSVENVQRKSFFFLNICLAAKVIFKREKNGISS